jgi:RNA polymerase sigma-70 factor, ECF subfamily
MLERLSQIVRAERGALVRIARSEGLSPEDALECVQDALCTFLTREQKGEGIPAEHAVASLVVMVRNAARNERRRHRHVMPHAPTETPSESPDAELLLASAEDVVRLRACVAELCSVQRAVVMLRLLEERSGEDVAAVLGITRSHVDVLVHRAKASLKVCMRHVTPT